MSFNFGTTAVAAPAASSGFSFGASTPAPAAGAAPTASGGFSFGGGTSTATPAPASGGFGFGGTATVTPTPASGGFSFGGASTAATSAPSSGGFSFGGTTSATPAPASTGFSFGGASTAAAPAPAASGGFSFGGTTTSAPTAAPASSGGFSFGAAAPATSTTGGGLFGGATTTTTPSLFGGAASGGSSMFGAKPAGTTPSLFGGAAAPAATTTSSFGGFGAGFGAAQQPAQAAMPAQPSIKLETTFDVLPADVKKNMTDFHKFLKDEDQSDAFLKSVSPRKLDALKGNLDQLEQDVLMRRNLQDRQATAVHHVRKDVKHLINQVDTATLNLRSMSGESTSQRFYGIMRRVEMPSPYYWELLDNFEARMEQLKAQIESVESEFKPLYDKQRRGGGDNGYDASSLRNVDPALLQQILVSQNTALIQVAAHVAEVHEKTEEMRQAFIRKMKEDMLKHGDKNLAGFKNPFDKKKKNSASRESDIDNIRFKTSVVPTIVATQQPTAQAAAPTSGFGGFGMTPAATGFGTTPGFGQTTATSTTGSSLFGGGTTATTVAAPTVSTGSGFSFGGSTTSTTAPKQVSFSLGGSTAPTVSTGAASTGFGFGAPATPAPGGAPTAAAPGGFGAVGSSFMPASTPAFGAGDKRAAGAASKSGGLRSRQKKR